MSEKCQTKAAEITNAGDRYRYANTLCNWSCYTVSGSINAFVKRLVSKQKTFSQLITAHEGQHAGAENYKLVRI